MNEECIPSTIPDVGVRGISTSHSIFSLSGIWKCLLDECEGFMSLPTPIFPIHMPGLTDTARNPPNRLVKITKVTGQNEHRQQNPVMFGSTKMVANHKGLYGL